MQILPIACTNKLNFTFNKGNTRVPRQLQTPADSFEFTGKSLFPLKEITHKSTEKLFNTDYIPQIPSKKGFLRTFVIDKNTDKFVDLYVKPNNIYENNILTKEFDFYRVENNKLKHVGYRTFDIDLKSGTIISGDMETFDKSLKGLGQRGLQLTVETANPQSIANIEALSLFNAYDFNYGCGFRVIDEFADANATLKSGFVELWQKLLKTDKETVKKMLVYKKTKDLSEVNLTASMVNFAQYANKKGLKMSDELAIPMKLTKPALKEWINLSKLKPILR